MMEPTTDNLPPPSKTDQQVTDSKEQAQPVAISDELIRRVTEKVYALWLREIRIERERCRTSVLLSY